MTLNICLINNFNYSKFLLDCLNSVFAQTVQFDKVVIVDDGSTDDSKKIIANFQKSHANLHAILKTNGGQLSTFNHALQYIDDDSQIFFLDADDIYPKDYLEQFQERVGKHYPDFTYCTPKSFKNDEISKVSTAFAGNYDSIMFYKTSAITRSRMSWIGNQTSCISISSSLYKNIFPYPNLKDYKTKADDVIVFSASIIGSKKLLIPSLQIGYRNHQNNHYHGKTITEDEKKIYHSARGRLFKWYCNKYSIPLQPSIIEFYSELKMLTEPQRSLLAIPSNFAILKRLIGRKYIWTAQIWLKQLL